MSCGHCNRHTRELSHQLTSTPIFCSECARRFGCRLSCRSAHLLGREAVLLIQLRRDGHQLLLCEVPARLAQHLVRLRQLRGLVHRVQPAEAPQGQR